MCCSGFFVYFAGVKFKPVKLAPALIAVGVIVLFCLLRVFHLEFFERTEKMSYDWRVRQAQRFPTDTATNLAFVYIDDPTIAFVKDRHAREALGYRYDLPWPRQVYGRLVEELAAQRAKVVGLDVIFAERRHDLAFVQMADGTNMDSDDYFALQMRRAKNVVLAITKDVRPPPIFATNALTLGDISTEKDPDGVLRVARAFRTNHVWNFAFQKLEADPDYGVDLGQARVEAKRVVLPRVDADDIVIPLDDHGDFEMSAFFGNKLPAGIPAKAKPFVDERVWHMGIVLAAAELGLDLNQAEIDLPHGRIVLRGPNGIQRTIPVDENGYFYVNWSMTLDNPHLTQEPMLNVLRQDHLRLTGQTNDLANKFAGKVVIVGSTASGNDLRDEGTTPLEADTYLVSKHWNVANSIITGKFVRTSSLGVDLLVILILGLGAALLIRNLPVRSGTALVITLAVVYFGLATFLYIHSRYWLPLVMPLYGMFVLTFALTLWRVLFEQAEQRRVKSVFSRMVSNNIMHEVLQAKNLALGGARREVTVLFADVRGFTEFTDKSQDQAIAYISENSLSQEAAEAYFDEQARETLNTVNTYLALVADQVKKHDGTLDKYIGDCVMAFWGAPTVMEKQALCCVRAAIDAQRAVFELNKQRVQENEKRELDNMTRTASGATPRPMLPILLLGTGINTGMATAGLMGSQDDRFNYTVFGREVNMASRLESLSGRGRILIGETTHNHLRRDDPALAATCTALPDLQKLKGFGAAVKVYEVPWRLPGSSPFDEEFATRIFGDTTHSTNFLKREK